MKLNEITNGGVIADYIATAPTRSLPAKVQDAARLCLADWIGVAIGAREEQPARIVRDLVASWRTAGRSTVLFGGNAAAPMAALANGTLAHCLDFDDTHIKSVTHTSAPVWAATLALGEEIDAGEAEMLSAFLTGFEVATCAGYGVGEAVTARGWHCTGVFGRIGAAAACAALLKLDAEHALHALGVAATQTSGLTASFGTMAKPFHAGKAAMDGVVAAQLAAGGFRAALNLLEPEGALVAALVQDKSVRMRIADFSKWEILDNSIKSYATCSLTHAAVDAARSVAPELDISSARAIRVEVSSLANQITGTKSGVPSSSAEAKFDLKYCVALALHGHKLSAGDFLEPWRPDDKVTATARKVSVVEKTDVEYVSTRLEIELEDGRIVRASIPIAKGYPGNPVSWEDMRDKFHGLVEPRLGQRTAKLFGLLGDFGSGRVYAEIRSILAKL